MQALESSTKTVLMAREATSSILAVKVQKYRLDLESENFYYKLLHFCLYFLPLPPYPTALQFYYPL